MTTWPTRRGVLMIEVVVAASILLMILSVTVSAAFRTRRLWDRIEKRSTAMAELTLAMDQTLPEVGDWPPGQTRDLPVDSEAQRWLPGVKIAATRRQDSHGDRLVMTIDWQRDGPQGSPIELVGWIDE